MKPVINFHLNRTIPYSVLFLCLFGCGVSNQVVAESNDTPKNAPSTDTKQDSRAMNKQSQIEFSKQHLAKKLNIDEQGITLAGAEAVTWRSGALGCPQPGKMYTQALVPGRLIMLKVGGKAYRYHASSKGAPFYCPNNFAESPSANPGDI
jgi:hypothetical protein